MDSRPAVMRAWPALLLLLGPLLGVTACSTPHYAGNGWDGRRGYDGNGDYGYDVNASRAEARSYRARAARRYPTPGPASDPWGPFIQEAASRHGVPERWIREVMRQESGGRLQGADGNLTTSNVGAMGLMQVMPATYDMLRRRYGLGDDPYEPHDNIMAGTAYIREMADRFGAPAFLAAYNAGPDRLSAYLAGNAVLPDETVNYLARIAPRLGTEVAMTGPLASFAGGTAYAAARSPRSLPAPGARPTMLAARPAAVPAPVLVADADRAYAGGGMTGLDYYAPSDTAVDPSDRAYEGGGLVTASAPTGAMAAVPTPRRPTLAYTPPPAPSPAPFSLMPRAYAATVPSPTFAAPTFATPTFTPSSSPSPAAMLVPVAAPVIGAGRWAIQVGAYPDPARSRSMVDTARQRGGALLASAQSAIIPVQHDGTLYRARLVGLSADAASNACGTLVRSGMACLTVPPGS